MPPPILSCASIAPLPKSIRIPVVSFLDAHKKKEELPCIVCGLAATLGSKQ